MASHYFFFFALTRNITDADARCIFILRYIEIPITHTIERDFHTNVYFMLLRIKLRGYFYTNIMYRTILLHIILFISRRST